jgi:hypothetical protein
MSRIFLAGLLTAAGLLSAAAALAPAARAAAFKDSLTVTLSPRDIWPPSPVTDLSAVPGAEGQMLLQWTAPDSNGYFFYPSVGAATGYAIRVASFSVAAVGGSTVTWWNAATDTRLLPAPGAGSAAPATPPVPLAPGTTQTLLLNGLDPSVTYYAMIISLDSAGLVSDADVPARAGAQAQAVIYDAAPPAPTGLTLTQTGPASFRVDWSSPAAYDLDHYRIYVDSAPPYDFAGAGATAVSSVPASHEFVGLSTGTYAVRVAAVDRGLPSYPGSALEGPASSSATITLFPLVHPPQEPYGLTLSSSGAGVSLSWLPVVRYADMEPFSVSTAPRGDELSGYRVYRATSPILGGWTDVADVSTATLSWTDLAGGPEYYYHVRSVNSYGLSDRSAIRTAATRSAYFVAPDDLSFFEVLAPAVAPLEGALAAPDGAYLIRVSSRAEDLGQLDGRVMKSIEFDAYRGGRLLAPDFAVADQGILSLHYELTADSQVAPSSARPPSARPGAARPGGASDVPSNMSVYWNNGAKWVQLYGKFDPAARTVTIRTKFFGRYQLRTVERDGGFSFNQAGVSNRFLTPNGDGKNDEVVFTFDNPRDAAVAGKILDASGHVIAGSLPAGPVSNSLVWDGTAGGRAVPGGVYIYVIQAEGQTFSGTVIVIK